MIDEIHILLDQYTAWLKDKTALRKIDDWVEITTPYLDRHNDYIQIYIRRDNGSYILTDDGYTIDDLKRSGCELESKKRRDLLTLTLNGFGAKLEENALVMRASSENFPLRKHNLLQAILAVNDLFYLSVPMVASLFLEDVTAWLDLNDIRYTPKVSLPVRPDMTICLISLFQHLKSSLSEFFTQLINQVVTLLKALPFHGLTQSQ